MYDARHKPRKEERQEVKTDAVVDSPSSGLLLLSPSSFQELPKNGTSPLPLFTS